jgi:uncharacterized membrane protein
LCRTTNHVGWDKRRKRIKTKESKGGVLLRGNGKITIHEFRVSFGDAEMIMVMVAKVCQNYAKKKPGELYTLNGCFYVTYISIKLMCLCMYVCMHVCMYLSIKIGSRGKKKTKRNRGREKDRKRKRERKEEEEKEREKEARHGGTLL